MVPEDLPFQFIKEITDDFSEERILGEGAFGIVYKGVTKNGQDVAVKKLKPCCADLDNMQFRNEFHTLVKLKHPNIVKVLGYCYETKKRTFNMPDGSKVFVDEIHTALCFEYLQNGSLQKHLSDESCEFKLDWHMRFKIIKGICEGLKYMHKDLEEPIYHFDLKPDNILLDKVMVPKIADFGLSRIFGQDIARTTHNPYGTPGYQPPEYIDRREISGKFDIFSLGAVMIRILAGPLSYPESSDISSYEYIDQVREIWRNKLQQTCSSNDSVLEEYCRQVETCTQIALDCLDQESQKRPDIVKVTEKLNGIEVGVGKLGEKGCGISVSQMRVQNNSIEMRTESKEDFSVKHQNTDLLSSPNRTKLKLSDGQQMSTDVVEELIIGREEEKLKIISALLESSSEKISILPIYGIGGIGKTTFSRLIYNDPKFNCYSKAWVHVSNRFDLNKIRDSVISQLYEAESQANERQVIHSCLIGLLRGNKIMIVLDDLWEDNPFQLQDLKEMLYHNDSKIIILVTTRSESVAERICINLQPYKILPLTNDMCWDIIKQRSGFGARDDKEQLMGIGQEISQKCAGVALAAQSLGFTLRGMSFGQWLKVKDNNIWKGLVSKDISIPNHVLPSLMLSYSYMDPCLKLCFTYCAIFQKGHEIVKNDLIYHWISLGFIKPTKLLSIMDLCKKYIMQLQGLSFFQASSKSSEVYDKNTIFFTMHDLVHDLAISLHGNQILDQSRNGNTRGSSCQYALLADCSKPLELCLASRARLIALRFLDCCNSKLSGAAFAPARSLRVLDLSECYIQSLPDSIGQLMQLRYLKAPGIHDQLLPNCITELSELKYLDISASEISALPESIGEMAGLVHLDISFCSEIEQLPVSFGNLENLVHLNLSYCSRITGVSEFLGRLVLLQYLDLSFCTSIGKQLPEPLSSLTELQYLNLSNCSYLQVREAEVLGNLSKLKYLNLSSESSPLSRLPEALGSFTELEYLNLSGCEQLEELPISFGKLCSLMNLNLSNCLRLNNIWDALGDLTKMQYLNLHQCSLYVFKRRQHMSFKGLQDAMNNLTELRYLNLGDSVYFISGKQAESFLGWISNLTNLEHLDLSFNDELHTVPDAFVELKKLHTLDLLCCSNLLWLPKSISEIDSLKFLNTIGCNKLDRSTLPQFKSSAVLLPHFVVRSCDGEPSSSLLLLKDEDPTVLEISRLENVKSAEEAQMIKLVEKRMIRDLVFEWTRDAERFVEDKEVLTELVPPSNLETFVLQGCNSLTFPSWVMDITTYLPQLTAVSLKEIPCCSALPPLGQLPNLSCLLIEQMHSIIKIGEDLYGGTRPFPALKQFHLTHMDNLQEWNWNKIGYSDEDGANVLVLPKLGELVIQQCPIFRFEPCPHIGGDSCHNESGDKAHQCTLALHLPALDFLVIKDCSGLTSSSLDILRGLSSLKRLKVFGCKSITAFPDCLGDLTCLMELCISDCTGIKRLPESIKQLTNLQYLTISDCPELAEWCESDEKIKKLLRTWE